MTLTRYEEALLAAARARPELVIMTAENRAALRGVGEALGERLVDVGICEATLVGAAAGLALCGRVPVVHALAPFLTMRAFEFIRTDVGLGRLPVKLVGSIAGLLSEANGPTHQAVEDVALMRAVPGMEIFCPADEDELVAGLPLALASPRPVYLRWNAAPATYAHAPLTWGRAEAVGRGRDVVLLAYGLLVHEAVVAAGLLADRGVAAHVLNLRTLAPLDAEAVRDAARDARLVVTIEDHRPTGGLFSLVAELLARGRARPPVLPIGLGERGFAPAMLADAIRHEGFTGARIATRVVGALQEID